MQNSLFLQIIIYKKCNFMEKYNKIEMIKKHSDSSPFLKDLLFSFFFGGAICTVGQLLIYLYSYLGAEKESAGTLVTITLIATAAILTALGVFDNIARVAGAGTLVPVTGFSNAVVSEAMDSSYEGYVLGVGAKIFTVAGPVILYGITSGVLYGVIYYIFERFL